MSPASLQMVCIVVALMFVASLVRFHMGVAVALSFILAMGLLTASLVTFLIPISAAGLGWLVLGERLEVRQFLGLGLIVAGLAVIDGRLFRRR